MNFSVLGVMEKMVTMVDKTVEVEMTIIKNLVDTVLKGILLGITVVLNKMVVRVNFLGTVWKIILNDKLNHNLVIDDITVVKIRTNLVIQNEVNLLNSRKPHLDYIVTVQEILWIVGKVICNFDKQLFVIVVVIVLPTKINQQQD